MTVLLQRFFHNTDETLGFLFIDGVPAGFTLEDQPQTVKVFSETRIPQGTYKLALTYSPKLSPKYGHDMILVADVPGFEGIRIHAGLTDDDTAGCVLVANGARFDPAKQKMVLVDSMTAYRRIYQVITDKLKTGIVVNLTIADDIFNPVIRGV